MSTWLSGRDVARLLRAHLPDAVEEEADDCLAVYPGALLDTCRHLQRELAIDYLNNLTAVDYLDYLEVVYHLSSLERNHLLTIKVRCYDREHAEVPSLTPLWQGADLQEREVYDLFGVVFAGHPNLKRLLMWEGFLGHPLRKDFVMPPFPQPPGSPVRKRGEELGLD